MLQGCKRVGSGGGVEGYGGHDGRLRDAPALVQQAAVWREGHWWRVYRLSFPARLTLPAQLPFMDTPSGFCGRERDTSQYHLSVPIKPKSVGCS